MKISQREARRLRARVSELEDLLQRQRSSWARKYVGGMEMGTLTRERDWFAGRLESAQRLGHALVAKVEDDGKIHFFALPL